MTGISAVMAIVFGVALAAGEVLRNWGHWQPWPFWLIDFIAAGTLIFGGLRTMRQGSSRLLSAAWGLTVGIFWMSFFSNSRAWNIEVQQAGSGGSADQSRLILVIGIMLLFAIVGLVLSLTRRKI